MLLHIRSLSGPLLRNPLADPGSHDELVSRSATRAMSRLAHKALARSWHASTPTAAVPDPTHPHRPSADRSLPTRPLDCVTSAVRNVSYLYM